MGCIVIVASEQWDFEPKIQIKTQTDRNINSNMGSNRSYCSVNTATERQAQARYCIAFAPAIRMKGRFEVLNPIILRSLL
jgi:hypothetical protein